MKNKNTDTHILETIRDLFDAEIDHRELSNEEEQFLKERADLEQRKEIHTLEGVAYYDELLEKHALSDKVLQNLQPMIERYFKNRRNELLQSKFYRKFKDNKVVSNVLVNIMEKTIMRTKEDVIEKQKPGELIIT